MIGSITTKHFSALGSSLDYDVWSTCARNIVLIAFPAIGETLPSAILTFSCPGQGKCFE